MSWLINADEPQNADIEPGDEITFTTTGTVTGTVKDGVMVEIAGVRLPRLILWKDITMGKEGSVYNDVDYQRDTLNIGDMGLFDEQHVTHEPDQSVDPGPASTTPGSAAPCSPGVFEY